MNDWAAADSSTRILDWIQQIEASYPNPRVWLCPASVSDVLQPTEVPQKYVPAKVFPVHAWQNTAPAHLQIH